MGCNCGKRNPPKKVECVGCGKKTTKKSKEFRTYWMRCPECPSPSKFACGRCLVKKGYKVKGAGKKKTKLYEETLKETIELSKKDK